MQRLVTLTGHRGQINAVALSPDGQTLVSGGTDGTIRFWNPASLQPR
jgi:WD40 repeat protein